MSNLWSNWKPVLLLGIVAVIWVTLTARWSPATWSSAGGIPEGDFLEVAARVQISAEQLGELRNTFGIIDRLGAPFGADWSGYPVPDRMIFGLAGLTAKVTGLYAAINSVILLGLLLNGWAFYGCARALRWHYVWACAGAILFTFSIYNLHWAGTLSLGWTFALPPAVLCLQWIASRNSAPPRRMARRMTLLAALLGLWIGAANPYFTYYISVLLGLSLLLQVTRHRVTERLTAGGVWLVAMLISFGLTHAAYLSQRLANDAHVGSMERNYAGTELYALRPIELFLPPAGHRNSTLARLGEPYRRQSMFQSREPNANYLGIFGVAGLGILAFAAFRHAASARRNRQVLSDAQLALIFTLLFTCVGGINGLVAYLGLDWFRASNRLSIFILIWCLFAIINWFRRHTQGSSQLVRTLGALGLVGLGLYDTLPRCLSATNHEAGLGQREVDHALTTELSILLPAGAMVFQLPATPFPEAGPRGSMGDYEHFQPFLTSSTLRFSYGLMAGTREFLWQQHVAQLPADEMIAALEQSGFSAIWINARAYADQGDSVIRDLTSHQRSEWLLRTPAPIRVVRLQPKAEPTLPDLDEFHHHRAWSGQTAGRTELALVALHGWYPLETDGDRVWRWARKRAEVGVWSPDDTPRARLTFRATALRDDVLELRHNGKTLLKVPLISGKVQSFETPLHLSAGNNRLLWVIQGDLTHPPGGDSRKLGFMVEALKVQPDVQPP